MRQDEQLIKRLKQDRDSNDSNPLMDYGLTKAQNLLPTRNLRTCLRKPPVHSTLKDFCFPKENPVQIKCKHCNKPVKIVNPAAAEPAKEHGILCASCRGKSALQRAFEKGIEAGKRLAGYGELPF